MEINGLLLVYFYLQEILTKRGIRVRQQFKKQYYLVIIVYGRYSV
jgi:hypothetical protein